MNQELQHAQNESLNVAQGQEFLLKDLFVGHKWNAMSVNDRRLLGTLFLHWVDSDPSVKHIQKMSKNSANQQVYSKK